MAELIQEKPHVVLLHNFLTPYRVPLFTELAKRFHLEVWILGDVSRIREWTGEAPEGAFRYRVLPNVNLSLKSRYNAFLLNYTIPFALHRSRHDVLIACGWDAPAMFWAAIQTRASGRPFILWSGSTPIERSWYRTLTRPAVRLLVRSASAWIAYGSRAKEYLANLGALPDRVFCAYNTVETDDFARASRLTPAERDVFRRNLGIQTPRVLLYCGNLLELKGLDDLVAGFAEFAPERSDVTLLLVGSGRDEARYRMLCREKSLTGRVIFAGYVPRADLPPYYAIADLLVLPSRSEVWGLVINEALACGVPVVAADVCGATADLLQDGVNGFVVPSRNPAALCAALEKFFGKDEAERKAMSEAARRSIAPFTIDRAADAFVDAVRCALNPA